MNPWMSPSDLNATSTERAAAKFVAGVDLPLERAI